MRTTVAYSAISLYKTTERCYGYTMIYPNKVREAYAGIETEEGLDLGEVLGDLVEEEGERLIAVAHSPDEFEKVTLRVCELLEIVRQNALVAIPSDADRSVPDGE
jgi:hypothetical protein